LRVWRKYLQSGKKLILAVRMMAEGSKYLHRTCRECISFQWSDAGVEGIIRKPPSRKTYRSLQVLRDVGATPTPRIMMGKLPCHECPKIPENAPAKFVYFATEVTDQSLETIQHFEECAAVQSFPDDPLVRRNAAIIRRVREECNRAERTKGVAYLMTVLAAGGGGR
jgi:hypothetical protein